MRPKSPAVEHETADDDVLLRDRIWNKWGDSLHTSLYWKAMASQRIRFDRNLRSWISLATCGSSASVLYSLGWSKAWTAVSILTSLALLGLAQFYPTEQTMQMSAIAGRWSRLAGQISTLFEQLPYRTPQEAHKRLEELMEKAEDTDVVELWLPGDNEKLKKKIEREVKEEMEMRRRAAAPWKTLGLLDGYAFVFELTKNNKMPPMPHGAKPPFNVSHPSEWPPPPPPKKK